MIKMKIKKYVSLFEKGAYYSNENTLKLMNWIIKYIRNFKTKYHKKFM